MSLYAASEEIQELAVNHRLPGPKKKFLWETILAQVAKRDSCDGSLIDDRLLPIIRSYLKQQDDQTIISAWLETESGFADDPEEVVAEWILPALEMEVLAEITRLAWDEAREMREQRKKKRGSR